MMASKVSSKVVYFQTKPKVCYSTYRALPQQSPRVKVSLPNSPCKLPDPKQIVAYSPVLRQVEDLWELKNQWCSLKVYLFLQLLPKIQELAEPVSKRALIFYPGVPIIISPMQFVLLWFLRGTLKIPGTFISCFFLSWLSFSIERKWIKGCLASARLF